jgi:hypothetical protein
MKANRNMKNVKIMQKCLNINEIMNKTSKNICCQNIKTSKLMQGMLLIYNK